ncbi:MAG: cupin domain-containing protein [Thermodesulfobacteriota bacterium]
MPITVEQLSPRQQESLRITDWPIWECAPSTFDWHYDQEESCLLLEGEVVVTTADQEVRITAGDYVTFPRGLDCVWRVEKAVRKHYTFR